MNLPDYKVSAITTRIELQKQWDGNLWHSIPTLQIAAFRPESSAHRPHTEVKVLRTPIAIHVFFCIADHFVRCVHSGFQQPVYQDSCVEFFVQPKPGSGYFNFEFNCGGAMLASYIIDHTRTSKGFRNFSYLTDQQCRQIAVYHSLPVHIEPERNKSITWFIEFCVPFQLLAEFIGPLGELDGQIWRANFYKCGDATSHPHWAAWSPVDKLNFHLPRCFGKLFF